MNEQDTMNYVGRRTDAILDSRTVRNTFLAFEDIYKLGQASVIGLFLALMQGNEDFKAEDFDEVRLSYYDTRDKHKEVTIFKFNSSWEVTNNKIDDDWRKVV